MYDEEDTVSSVVKAAVAVAAAAATLAPVLFGFATLFWFENDGLFIEKPMIKTP